MTRALATVLLSCLLSCMCALSMAHADDEEDRPSSVRIRHDTILRLEPRYVLTADETAASADARYWRVVTALPVYDRIVMDGYGLTSADLEVHLSAWGAIDVAATDRTAELAAGDFATAFARIQTGPLHWWGGRRFLTWGLPGGLHLDGVGTELRTKGGLRAELLAGRPVTPRYDSLPGPRPSFTGATFAAGARVGYSAASKLNASLAYLERWAHGIPADRVSSLDLTWMPAAAVDLRGGVVLDWNSIGIERAHGQASLAVTRGLELLVGYEHADPSLLLPSWSILSVFATNAYHEASAGVTLRLSQNLSVGAEGAARYYDTPGDQGEPSYFGYRADALLRWRSTNGHTRALMRASRRHDGVVGLTVLRAAGVMRLFQGLDLALEASAALDDDASDRSSLFARLSAEVPVGDAWRFSASVDGAQSPIADAEVRGMLRASWHTRIAEGAR